MKKLSRNSAGFGVIGLILIVVVIGLLGFAGWYVYQQNNKDKTEGQSTETIDSETPEVSESETTLPEGFKEYENDELGFKFAYPDSWKLSDSTYKPDFLLQLTAASPDKQNRDVGGMTYVADGGEFTVTVTEASSGDFTVIDGEYSYQGKDDMRSLDYFSYKNSIEVDGSDAIKGSCGHNNLGNCVYILHNDKLFEFGYFQPNTNVIEDTDTPSDKYLNEFDTAISSIDFLN